VIPFYESITHEMRSFINNGINFPLHLHQQLELIYIHKGEQDVTIADQRATLYEGDIAIIFPDCIHGFESKKEGTRSQLVLCDIRHTGIFMNKLLNYYPINPFLRKASLSDNIPYALTELCLEYQGDYNIAACTSFIQLILSRIFPLLELESKKDKFSTDYTSQIANYIHNKYKEPITLDDLAAYLGLSKYHVSHIFAKSFKMSFPKYLNSIRLNQAMARIETTRDSLLDICLEVGFNSQRTFNRIFKDIYHMTPGEYRKTLGQSKDT